MNNILNTDPFGDQHTFMTACEQTVDTFNPQQFALYTSLISEEVDELAIAIDNNDRLEALDALIDIMVVTVGALHSLGADGRGAWSEVMRSNFAKIDPTTGKVIKRPDGKVMKPPGWEPPQLEPYLKG